MNVTVTGEGSMKLAHSLLGYAQNYTLHIFIFQLTKDHTSNDESELESDAVPPQTSGIVKSEVITSNCDQTVQNTDFS